MFPTKPLIHTFVDPEITRKQDDAITVRPYLAPRKEKRK